VFMLMYWFTWMWRLEALLAVVNVPLGGSGYALEARPLLLLIVPAVIVPPLID